MHDLDDLAAAYWDHHRLSSSSERADRLRAPETSWAWEEVEEFVRLRPDDAIEVLVLLADGAPDDAALAYLGAGPIENLVCTGSDFMIDRVEGAAARNGSFRKALRCAWFDEHVAPAVAARLRRFGDPY